MFDSGLEARLKLEEAVILALLCEKRVVRPLFNDLAFYCCRESGVFENQRVYLVASRRRMPALIELRLVFLKANFKPCSLVSD